MDLHSIAFLLLILAGLSVTTPAVSLIFLGLALAAISTGRLEGEKEESSSNDQKGKESEMVKLTIEEYKEFRLLSELIPYGLVMTLTDEEGIIIDNYCIAIGEYIHTSANKAIGKKYH